MASQLVSSTRFRQSAASCRSSKTLSCDDNSCNLSLSHSQNSCYHRLQCQNNEPSGLTITHCKPKNGEVEGNASGSSQVGKSRGHVVQRPHLRVRRLMYPGSYLLRKLRALYFGIRDEIMDSSVFGNEAIAVEPYFSIPVVPVTTTTAPHA